MNILLRLRSVRGDTTSWLSMLIIPLEKSIGVHFVSRDLPQIERERNE